MFLPPLLKWAEYVLFASLLVAVCIIFSIMAYFYTYIDPTEIEAQFKKNVNADDGDDKLKMQKMSKRDSASSDSSDDDDNDDKRKQTKMWTHKDKWYG